LILRGFVQLIQVGTQVGNGLDVTVKYIDDKTGNVASAKWNKLDKATQDQIRGGGRILSVIVPVGTAGKIVKGIKEAKALRKLDKLIANGKNDSADWANSQFPKKYSPLSSATWTIKVLIYFSCSYFNPLRRLY
jgi:hypothetical protein